MLNVVMLSVVEHTKFEGDTLLKSATIITVMKKAPHHSAKLQNFNYGISIMIKSE